MKKRILTFIFIIGIIFILTGCSSWYKHSRSELKQYTNRVLGHKNYSLSYFRKKDSNDKYWNVKDRNNNFKFRIIADTYYASEWRHGCLSDDIDDVILTNIYENNERKNNVQIKEKNGGLDLFDSDLYADYIYSNCYYYRKYLTCTFSNSTEAENCINSFKYYEDKFNTYASSLGYSNRYFNHHYIHIDKYGAEHEYEFGILTSETNSYLKSDIIYDSEYEYIRSIVKYGS